MTAHNVIRLPVPEAAFDRIVARDREANIAAEREEDRQAALFVIRNHAWHSRQEVEDAWVNLARCGDEHERAVAQVKVAELAEAPVRAAFREPQYRWPAVLAGAVTFTGFWWGVVALVMAHG